MKARDFDKEFDEGGDIPLHLDISKAKTAEDSLGDEWVCQSRCFREQNHEIDTKELL
jgi:hypothetical protein